MAVEGTNQPGESSVVQDEELDTVESVMNKLGVERRVQFGAEKMLHVIEQRGSDPEAEQMKSNIIAQLDAANERIKVLEARLERVKAETPSRHPRRRPQPRLNGYGSNQSLLSSSVGSSSMMSGGSRPRPSRQGSSFLSPDREADLPDYYPSSSGHGTPTRTGPGASPSVFSSGGGMGRPRQRSHSIGEESDASAPPTDRFPWSRQRSRSNLTSPGDVPLPEDENTSVLLETLSRTVRRLTQLGSAASSSGGAGASGGQMNGKGKEREIPEDRELSRSGDEVWDCLIKVGDALKKTEALRYLVNAEDVVLAILPFMGDSSHTRRRAAGYRALRYVLDRQAWGKMLSTGIEWILIRSFTRDSKCVQEREQALKLLRGVIALPLTASPRLRPQPSQQHSRSSPVRSRPGHSRHGSAAGLPIPLEPEALQVLLECRVPLTDGLVRALVSAAENPDDVLRTASVQTLVEIGVYDLPRLVQSDAFRTVLLAFKDGPHELGASLTGFLLYCTNKPATRHLLLPGADLEMVLVGLTEEFGKPSARHHARFLEKLQHSVMNVSMLLSSWAGMLYMCMDNFRAVKSLISSLHVPATEMRDAIMDLFFSCLRIKAPAFLAAFLEGKRLTVYNRAKQATSQQLLDEPEKDERPQHLNLVDHFVALLLAIFIESDILGALVAIIAENDAALSRKATLLLGEILLLANRLLPLQFSAQLQAIPQLFLAATTFNSPDDRNMALTALASIESLQRNLAKAAKDPTGRERSTSNAAQNSLLSVQNVKLRMGLQIDDKVFERMLVDSGVLLDKDHTKWSFDIITDLIEGPLLNPKRLEETIKATKFIRRLFSFFYPFNNRFSAMKKTRPNHKWVKLACSLLSTMLVCPEGIKFLSEDKLLRQLMESFLEVEHNPSGTAAIFSKERLLHTLTYGYFDIIGVLSKHREGLKLLEKFKLFNCFYRLAEQRSRDDIIRIVIECFDYTIDGHPRIVLSKALTSSWQETRLFATHHLGRILHEQPALQDWSLQLMVTQLYDVASEVCDVAVMYLEDMCSDPHYLEKVVAMRPTLEHLGDLGHPLFMRFVSTSAGFEYLHQTDYIDQELETWVSERNILYVIEVETFVSGTLRPFLSDTNEENWQYDGMAPTHFFGELTKTPEGCLYLKSKGYVAEFAEIIRLHGMEASDDSVLMQVKSALWALGNIGSTEGGLPFLEDEEILEAIVEVATLSPVLTMKGTCFFVLGLISTTRQGAELLEELGWIATRTPTGKTTGICLPNDVSRFVRIEPWRRPEMPLTIAPLPALSGLEGEIMTAIANLSNYVLAAGAMSNLKRLRSKHARYFQSITLFHRALRIISTNHFQAPVRRFILDLFDVPLESDTLVQLRHLEVDAHNPSRSAPSASLPSSRLPSARPKARSSASSASVPGSAAGSAASLLAPAQIRPRPPVHAAGLGVMGLSERSRSDDPTTWSASASASRQDAYVPYGQPSPDGHAAHGSKEYRRRSASSPGPLAAVMPILHSDLTVGGGDTGDVANGGGGSGTTSASKSVGTAQRSRIRRGLTISELRPEESPEGARQRDRLVGLTGSRF